MKPCDRRLTSAESARLDAIALMVHEARSFSKLLGKVSTAVRDHNAAKGGLRLLKPGVWDFNKP